MKKDQYDKFEGTKQINNILKDDEKKAIFSDDREKARNAWLKMNKERLDEIENKRLASIRAVIVLNVITVVALLCNLLIQIL